MLDLYNDLPNVTKVSSFTYNSVLNKYNIGFFRPKKDACSRCTQYRNSEKTADADKNQKEHLENKEMAREEKERDKLRAENDQRFVAINGDMQQVSPCPKGNASEFFYVSKISCYNYSIYNLGTKDGYCYRWDESIAKRGADEIASCVHHFLFKEISKDVEEVVIWSDTCGGQNRNPFLSAVILNIIDDESNSIKLVTLKYFETGHSDSEVDNIHSALETAVKTVEIFSPNEYVTLTKVARKAQPNIPILLGTDECPVYNAKNMQKRQSLIEICAPIKKGKK